MISAPLKIVETVRVALAERVLPQLDAATWLAGDVRSSIALLTYLEDVLTNGTRTMALANAAMAGFLGDIVTLPALPDAVRSEIAGALAQGAERTDLTGLERNGRTMKAAISAVIAARDEGAFQDADIDDRLRACLREVAKQELALAERAGAMSPF